MHMPHDWLPRAGVKKLSLPLCFVMDGSAWAWLASCTQLEELKLTWPWKGWVELPQVGLTGPGDF